MAHILRLCIIKSLFMPNVSRGNKFACRVSPTRQLANRQSFFFLYSEECIAGKAREEERIIGSKIAESQVRTKDSSFVVIPGKENRIELARSSEWYVAPYN